MKQMYAMTPFRGLTGCATLGGMTVVDEVVVESPTTPPSFRWTPRARIWAAGLVGFAVGAGGVIAVSDLRAHPAVAVPTSATVGFNVVGDATVDYAGIWAAGFANGPVDPQATYTVRAPYTVIFTVRSDPGGKARCQILVDGRLATERLADDESVTCVAVG